MILRRIRNKKKKTKDDKTARSSKVLPYLSRSLSLSLSSKLYVVIKQSCTKWLTEWITILLLCFTDILHSYGEDDIYIYVDI